MSSLTYAIDFGTSNSLLAAADSERVYAPIPLDDLAKDPTIFRSLLYFPTRDECFFGVKAVDEFVAHDLTGRFVRSVKKFLPMKSFVGTVVDNRLMNLEDIIGTFLGEMRRRANAHFEQDVVRVVLGRPAKFSLIPEEDEYAQSRLERAAKKAGFQEISFFPEPVAAAYGYQTELDQPKIILVADFGGGTSDFTVMSLQAGEKEYSSEVLSIGGVSVAGDALDGCLMRHRISRFFGSDVQYKVPFGENILTMPTVLMEKLCSPADLAILRERDTRAFLEELKKWSTGEDDQVKLDRLFTLLDDQLGFSIFEAIERVKRALSTSDEGRFEFNYPTVELDDLIRRTEFEEYTKSKVDQVMSTLDATVKDTGLRFSEIDLVCCTGGTAQVPALSDALTSRFGAEKIIHHHHYHGVIEGLAKRALEWNQTK